MRQRAVAGMMILAIGLTLASFLFPVRAGAASSGRYHSLTSDGTLYAVSSDNYESAQEATTGTVEYTTTGLRVGQDNATDTYSVWRAVLFFDTNELPAGATVSSATVTLHGKSNHSDTDFSLVLVQPGDMHSPMEEDDYGMVYGHDTSLAGAWSTGSYASEFTLTLNGDGVEALMHEGVTVFCLRSQEDINGSAPSGEEYIDLYSSESGSPPVLTVNYYPTAYLGDPDTKQISSVAVFSGYYETGDQLYVARANIDYDSGIDNLEASDYFEVQLRHSDNVVAAVPLWDWGYIPVSIYLSADHALAADTYTMVIAGRDEKFPDGAPFISHTMLNTEYKGTDMTALDAWVMGTAIDIGHSEHDDLDYYRTQVAGQWVLNDMGGDMMVTAIPLLDGQRRHIFANPGLYGDQNTGGDAYEGSLWANWGVNFAHDWDLIGQISGVSGVIAASLAFLALAAAVVIVVQKETGKPALGIIVAVAVLLLGNILGVPFFMTVGAAAIGAAYFYKELLLGQSA